MRCRIAKHGPGKTCRDQVNIRVHDPAGVGGRLKVVAETPGRRAGEVWPSGSARVSASALVSVKLKGKVRGWLTGTV